MTCPLLCTDHRGSRSMMNHARVLWHGPLSQWIAKGRLRSATIASNTRVTLRLAKLGSTSNAKHSRV